MGILNEEDNVEVTIGLDEIMKRSDALEAQPVEPLVL